MKSHELVPHRNYQENMSISRSIERERQALHPTDPLVYHMAKVKWTHFITLTFRVVPPEHIQRKCIFEFTRRVLKEFNQDSDFNWGTNWIFRREFGEKNGRCHYHALMVLDKPYPNAIATCKKIEHIWSNDVASRQVGRYNEEKEKHNAKLRRELRFKPSEERDEEYARRCRPHIRNDFSSPGYADVRQFDPNLEGVDYVMKGEDWSYSGANAYELGKFNERDNTNHILSHSLLMNMFLRVSGRSHRRRDKILFHKGLVESTNTSRIGPQGIFRKAPNVSRTLWDLSPAYSTDQEWSWTESQY